MGQFESDPTDVFPEEPMAECSGSGMPPTMHHLASATTPLHRAVTGHPSLSTAVSRSGLPPFGPGLSETQPYNEPATWLPCQSRTPTSIRATFAPERGGRPPVESSPRSLPPGLPPPPSTISSPRPVAGRSHSGYPGITKSQLELLNRRLHEGATQLEQDTTRLRSSRTPASQRTYCLANATIDTEEGARIPGMIYSQGYTQQFQGRVKERVPPQERPLYLYGGRDHRRVDGMAGAFLHMATHAVQCLLRNISIPRADVYLRDYLTSWGVLTPSSLLQYQIWPAALTASPACPPGNRNSLQGSTDGTRHGTTSSTPTTPCSTYLEEVHKWQRTPDYHYSVVRPSGSAGRWEWSPFSQVIGLPGAENLGEVRIGDTLLAINGVTLQDHTRWTELGRSAAALLRGLPPTSEITIHMLRPAHLHWLHRVASLTDAAAAALFAPTYGATTSSSSTDLLRECHNLAALRCYVANPPVGTSDAALSQASAVVNALQRPTAAQIATRTVVYRRGTLILHQTALPHGRFRPAGAHPPAIPCLHRGVRAATTQGTGVEIDAWNSHFSILADLIPHQDQHHYPLLQHIATDEGRADLITRIRSAARVDHSSAKRAIQAVINGGSSGLHCNQVERHLLPLRQEVISLTIWLLGNRRDRYTSWLLLKAKVNNTKKGWLSRVSQERSTIAILTGFRAMLLQHEETERLLLVERFFPQGSLQARIGGDGLMLTPPNRHPGDMARWLLCATQRVQAAVQNGTLPRSICMLTPPAERKSSVFSLRISTHGMPPLS